MSSLQITPPITPVQANEVLSATSPYLPSKYPASATAHYLLPTPPYTPEITQEDLPDALRKLSVQSAASDTQPTVQRRQLSDNELSYYLPSRGDGVNDMYLHHTLIAPTRLMSFSRLLHIWAYQLLRHPLLASQIQFDAYDSVSFVHTPHSSLASAIEHASDRFRISRAGNGMISTYLNGPRILDNTRLSCLFLGTPSPFSPPSSPCKEDNKAQYELMLCATHFLGDGMALHTFMNEFYTLVGGDKTTEDFVVLILEALSSSARELPSSLEERLPFVGDGSRLAKAVGAEEYLRFEARLIGDQAFPRNSVKLERHTAVPTFGYTAEETKTILSKCKLRGVTIAHAMFALCNIAWSRRTSSTESPCMIYSALNLRPNMLPSPTPDQSFFHLAVGYFNIVLPSLLPPIPTDELFWHRARLTKAQTAKAVKSPFIIARSRETSKVRRARAIKWAKIDDEDEAKKNANPGLGFGMVAPPSQVVAPKPAPDSTPAPVAAPTTQNAPQKALMGVSMLGNLDGMYQHKAFPALQLSSLTTGSRQRAGALLLFAYTFAGRLWMSLGYDVNGFAPGAIEGFWDEVQALVREVLL